MNSSPTHPFVRALGRTWWLALLGLLIGVVVGVPIQALKITGAAPQYIMLAKLVVGPLPRRSASLEPQVQAQMASFATTVIETLQSSALQSKALDRMRALSPELTTSDVTVKAVQLNDSMMVSVLAIGSEPKFTRQYLEALLDELGVFFDTIKEQRRSKETTALAYEVVALGDEVKAMGKKLAGLKANTGPDGKLSATDAVEAQRLEAEAEAKNRTYRMKFDAVRELQTLEAAQPDNFSVIESPTGALQDVQQMWAIRLAVPVVLGFVGGIAVMLLAASIIAMRMAARAS